MIQKEVRRLPLYSLNQEGAQGLRFPEGSRPFEFFWIKEIDPAAVDSHIFCRKHHMDAHNRGIFGPGIAGISRIMEDTVPIIGYGKDN